MEEVLKRCTRHIEVWRGKLEKVLVESRDMELNIIREIRKGIKETMEEERRRMWKEREREEAGYAREREEWKNEVKRLKEKIRMLEGNNESRGSDDRRTSS